mmetsp:Transcript_55155/g.96583  ORF Transcript_55155/g.96583 Transcript_55155/m.96583 type:complete len:251 (-) Transcript_55155:2217-2969(-)
MPHDVFVLGALFFDGSLVDADLCLALGDVGIRLQERGNQLVDAVLLGGLDQLAQLRQGTVRHHGRHRTSVVTRTLTLRRSRSSRFLALALGRGGLSSCSAAGRAATQEGLHNARRGGRPTGGIDSHSRAGAEDHTVGRLELLQLRASRGEALGLLGDLLGEFAEALLHDIPGGLELRGHSGAVGGVGRLALAFDFKQLTFGGAHQELASLAEGVGRAGLKVKVETEALAAAHRVTHLVPTAISVQVSQAQ